MGRVEKTKTFGWNMAPAVARCRVCARVLVFVDSNTRATVLQNLGSAWGKHRCVDWWFAYVSCGSPCGFLVVFWWLWWLSWLWWWWWYVVVFSITGNCRLCRNTGHSKMQVFAGTQTMFMNQDVSKDYLCEDRLEVECTPTYSNVYILCFGISRVGRQGSAQS